MKYCPFCGAEIINGAVSFCAECGENLKSTEKAKPTKKDKKPKKEKAIPKEITEPELQNESEEIPQDDYDGYYDDVLPSDSQIIRQTLDKELIKKIALLIIGVLAVIGACVALMYVL